VPLQFSVGEKFPDFTLLDDRDREVSLADVAEKQPLILAFYRGPW